MVGPFSDWGGRISRKIRRGSPHFPIPKRGSEVGGEVLDFYGIFTSILRLRKKQIKAGGMGIGRSFSFSAHRVASDAALRALNGDVQVIFDISLAILARIASNQLTWLHARLRTTANDDET